MNIREEEFSLEFYKECREDFKRHLEEVQVVDSIPTVDYVRYIRASQRGELVLFVARSNGNVVGYLLYWLIQDVNHELFIAQQAGLYLAEEYRKGMNAVELIKFAERALKEDYEVDVIAHVSTAKKDISPLFRYLKYKEAETIYIKEI